MGESFWGLCYCLCYCLGFACLAANPQPRNRGTRRSNVDADKQVILMRCGLFGHAVFFLLHSGRRAILCSSYVVMAPHDTVQAWAAPGEAEDILSHAFSPATL